MSSDDKSKSTDNPGDKSTLTDDSEDGYCSTDLEDDVEVKDTNRAWSSRCSTVYCKLSGDMKQPVVQKVSDALSGSALELPSRHLGPDFYTTMSLSLVDNRTLTKLDLSYNDLGYFGGRLLTIGLMVNCSIRDVNVAGNKFGSTHASAYWAQMMLSNSAITHLNLSDNNFTDEDCEILAIGVQSNQYMLDLDMGHNEMSLGGAGVFAKAVATNETLKKVNLRWNSIRKEGAVYMSRMIKCNFCVTHVDLSYNGMGYEGALSLKDSLLHNNRLLDINVESNRIDWEGALLFAQALEGNESLKVIRLGNNPLTTTGVMDLIDAVANNAKSSIEVLDVQNVPVTKDFIMNYQTLKETRPNLTCVYGKVTCCPDVVGQRSKPVTHPMSKIVEYMYSKELRPVEMMRSFDKNVSFCLKPQEFIRRSKQVGINLHSWEIEPLVSYILDRPDRYKDQKGITYSKLTNSIYQYISDERRRRIFQRQTVFYVRKYSQSILHINLPATDSPQKVYRITGITPDISTEEARETISEYIKDQIKLKTQWVNGRVPGVLSEPVPPRYGDKKSRQQMEATNKSRPSDTEVVVKTATLPSLLGRMRHF